MTLTGWLYIIIAILAMWAIIATTVLIVIFRWYRRIERLADRERQEQEELSKRNMDYTL